MRTKNIYYLIAQRIRINKLESSPVNSKILFRLLLGSLMFYPFLFRIFHSTFLVVHHNHRGNQHPESRVVFDNLYLPPSWMVDLFGEHIYSFQKPFRTCIHFTISSISGGDLERNMILKSNSKY